MSDGNRGVKQRRFGHGQKGTSGYLKRKKDTLKELNKALDTEPKVKESSNAADNAGRALDEYDEPARVRHIFDD